MVKMIAQVSWEGGSQSIVVKKVPAKVELHGGKALGLSEVPESWQLPTVVVPIQIFYIQTESKSFRGRCASAILAYLESQHQEQVTEVIARSSAPLENLDMRGHYYSRRCRAEVQELAATVWRVAFQSGQVRAGEAHDTEKTNPVCAVVIQPFKNAEQIGHLSNEYRHASKSVDFLYEIEEPDGSALMPILGPGPGAFRLSRPMNSPPTREPINLDNNSSAPIKKALRAIAAWLVSTGRRSHIEWIADRQRMFVVQLDLDELPPAVRPMSQYSLQNGPALPKNWTGAIFQRVDDSRGFAELRKTRSHALLHGVGAFVPPIFVALQAGGLIRDADSPIWEDLEVLLASPSIIRFDVPLARSDWTNLPTIGPTKSPHAARKDILTAVEKCLGRGLNLDELSIVVHRFIAARASAWSECQTSADSVRIDAIWGLPDGLQAFVHDSFLVNSETGGIVPQVRYKDRYFDVADDGTWITRRSFPSLAREPACEEAVARDMARLTLQVREKTGKPTRIMWFLDVVRGGGEDRPAAMPWIVVEILEESTLTPPWLRSQSDATPLKKRIDLYSAKAIRNRSSLERFKQSPNSLDIGDRHVVLEPDASVIRDRVFLKEFSEVINSLSDRWTVVFSGSMLAHAPYQLQQLGVPVLPIHQEVIPPKRRIQRKLVRDGIPAKIEAHGEQAEVVELEQAQYLLALRQKLVEEALEVAYSSDSDEVREELADLLAVARSLADASGLESWSAVEEEEKKKRARRGGFTSRLYLGATGFGTAKNRPRLVGHEMKRLRGETGIRIPMIPPLLSGNNEKTFQFRELGLAITVKFREQCIDVSISSQERSRRKESSQLLLFDLEHDEEEAE